MITDRISYTAYCAKLCYKYSSQSEEALQFRQKKVEPKIQNWVSTIASSLRAIYTTLFTKLVILAVNSEETKCLDVVKEEKVWEKEALSVTGRC